MATPSYANSKKKAPSGGHAIAYKKKLSPRGASYRKGKNKVTND